MEEKAFAVKFECENCGAKWEEQFCRRDRVKGLPLGRVYIEDHRCTRSADCPYCRYVKCPVCEGDDDILIRERYPLREERQTERRWVHEVEFVDGTTYSGYIDGVKVKWKTNGLMSAK